MRMKNLIAILLTAVIFVAVAVLGVSTVYRVSAVTLEVSVVSDDARTEASTLEKQLSALYKKESIFSVTDGKAKEVFADYPYFRLTGLKKSYPNRLIFSATEDPEVYAFEKEGKDGYYILGGDGTLLCERKTPENRRDKKANVVVSGLKVSGALGAVPEGEDFATLLTFLSALDRTFGGIRTSVVAVNVSNPTSSPEYTNFLLTMREGVTVNVYNPASGTVQKAEALTAFYNGLSVSERLSGRIDVTDYLSENGKYKVTYSLRGAE